MRVGLGAVLGATALGACWALVGTPWITAAAAALLAPIGFLGSYFLWSADRPEEGYEQVLFDRPNTRVAATMLVAFALLGAGSGLLPAGGGDGRPAAAGELFALRDGYQRISDAYATKEADADATVEALNALRMEADAVHDGLEVLADGAPKDALLEAYDHLVQAILALKTCAAGDPAKCTDARVLNADAAAALDRYEALSG